MSGDVLVQLSNVIRERSNSTGDSSYTRQLLDGGVERCAKKFGEEAVEMIIAAMGQSDEDLGNEAADVLYHLLVLLQVRGVRLEDVLSVLEKRTGRSGLEEKASRGS
ncbi:MAG: phosphoribosyl-ATP diphosphatase [Hyphomicrobiaceae bacterium]